MDSASLVSNNITKNSCLTHPNTPEVPYDVVCVGFGPAALSLAIALYEQPRPLRVLFIEQQSSFSWRGENFPMDRSQMRTNLLQDLVTMRDPLSKFTFLNYLWSTNSLVGYTNLGQMNPPRLLFAKYLAWCASHMDAKGWTRYGQTVQEMEPLGKSDDEVELWKINIQETKTRTAVSPVFAKKVILALGEQPKLPRALSGLNFNNQVLHSVNFMKCLPRLRDWQGSSLNIAIVGGNDEAVEIVEQCQSYLDTARVTLFINDPALRQTDENPFIRNLTALSKTQITTLASSTPQSTVQTTALADLYTNNYEHSLRARRSQKPHLFTINPSTTILSASHHQNRITLNLLNPTTNQTHTSEPFDFIFVASGYERGLQEALIAPAKHLLDSRDGSISVNGEYKVLLRRGAVARDVGVWIMDAFARGGEDGFPSVALRAGMVARGLLGSYQVLEQGRREVEEERAVL